MLLMWTSPAGAQPADDDLPAGVRVAGDLEFAAPDGHDLKLDLYWHPDAEEPTPLVIWVHGGAWRGGGKSNPRPALHLLEHGYAVASVQYRLSQHATFPAQIQDVKAAVRWLRAQAGEYKIDPARFGAFGPSAGGHLVAMLGTSGDVVAWEVGEHLDQSSRVQAVVDWFGPSDFLRMNDVPGRIDHDAPDSPESQLVGAPIQERPDLTAAADPGTYATPDDPPILIMHGLDDKLVIPGQSELLHAKLQEAGAPSTLVLLEGLGHGGDGWSEQLSRVVAFFDEHL